MSPFAMNATKKVVLSLVAVLITGLGMGIPAAARTVVIEDELIGYWSFDEDTVKGKTVADIWGNQDAEMIRNLQSAWCHFVDRFSILWFHASDCFRSSGRET